MAVSMVDVAKQAGIPANTLAKVLRDEPGVDNNTRQKVLDLINSIEYIPNFKNTLKSSVKTNTIAVISPSFSSAFDGEVMKGIEKVFANPGFKYDLVQYPTMGQMDVKIRIFDSIIFGKRADAIICLSQKPPSDIIDICMSLKIPVVLIDEKADGCYSLSCDNYKGAYKATDYLIKKGKKKIVLINGDSMFFSGGSVDEEALSEIERKKGYMDALRAGGLPVEMDLMKISKQYYFEDGQEIMRSLANSGIKYDSIFCAAGDMVAFGAMTAARKMGIRIPEDIAIIGYDDIEISAISIPPLTTIKQPIAAMGEQAVKIAVAAMENRPISNSAVVFEPELIVRETT